MFIDYANTSRPPRRSYHLARMLSTLAGTLLVLYCISRTFHHSYHISYYVQSVSYAYQYALNSVNFILHPPTSPPTINFVMQEKNVGTALVTSGYTLESDVVPKDKIHNVASALKEKGFTFSKHTSTLRPGEVYFKITGGNQSSMLIQARRLLNHLQVKSSIFIAR